MRGMKRGVAFTLMLVAVAISACEQPYSQAPEATNTPINPNSLFATPANANPTGLSPAEVFATQTAQGVDPSLLSTVTPGEAPQNPTVTSTPFVQLPSTPSSTPTATLALPSGPTNTPLPQLPSGSVPSTYTLRSEEFPFCIARRYGIDPDALLRASALSSPDIYYAGLVLTIPAGPAWSEATLGPRALRAHPATYVVTGNADTTVYGVACKFGDLTPDAIVAANSGLSLGSTFTVGQNLSVP
ncbi:MAG: LysM peptidoglycan-binding domain-containing protein [Anaerolineales bacterium]|nr:LysM peptidoglycan-binding domain-containing protein [Anaerolineales bacterium]